jgi:hypothetical protein
MLSEYFSSPKPLMHLMILIVVILAVPIYHAFKAKPILESEVDPGSLNDHAKHLVNRIAKGETPHN